MDKNNQKEHTEWVRRIAGGEALKCIQEDKAFAAQTEGKRGRVKKAR